MTVSTIIGLLAPTRNIIPRNPGPVRVLPAVPKHRDNSGVFNPPVNTELAASDSFTRLVTVKQADEAPKVPAANNKEALGEPFAALSCALDTVMDRLYDNSDPHDRKSVYFTHAPSVGEKRKRMFIYTNGSQALSLKGSAIEEALGKAGILPSGQHIQKLTFSNGYQESKATGFTGNRQMGGFGPFHIMFRHGQPVYETDSSYDQTLRPEYRETVSRFFDSRDNSFATPKQIGQWIGEAITKGHVTGIESSEWEPQMKLVTLTHHFNHGVGRRVESERGQLRYQRNWQGPINFNNVRVVVGYHPKHPSELYLYTAYPTP